MAGPVRVRPLSADEDAALLRIVPSADPQETIQVRQKVMIGASAQGVNPPMITRLSDADPDTVRDVIRAFCANGLATLDPRFGPGGPRRITAEDESYIVRVTTTRPRRLGRPFTHWSLRKLADHVADNRVHVVVIGRERLRQILRAHQVSFQRTRTWKESTDTDYDAKLDRIEQVPGQWPDRCFPFDQFGPLNIRPCHGNCWARRKYPDRIRVTYHRVHGNRYFHGCYGITRDQLWGITPLHKGGANSLAALQSIRTARPDGRKLDIIPDNLSCNETPAIRAWPPPTGWSCASPWPGTCRPTCAGATHPRQTPPTLGTTSTEGRLTKPAIIGGQSTSAGHQPRPDYRAHYLQGR